MPRFNLIRFRFDWSKRQHKSSAHLLFCFWPLVKTLINLHRGTPLYGQTLWPNTPQINISLNIRVKSRTRKRMYFLPSRLFSFLPPSLFPSPLPVSPAVVFLSDQSQVVASVSQVSYQGCILQMHTHNHRPFLPEGWRMHERRNTAKELKTFKKKRD